MADTSFIACSEQSVPDKEARDLILWLNKPEANTLKRVVESMARVHMANVANLALQAAGDAPLKVNVADENLRIARRYLDFLDTLKWIREQQQFTVTKWQ